MNRVYNFSAGPSALPEAVLRKAAQELVNYQDQGLSVMEMSHRSQAFLEIISSSQELLRELMNIPDNYQILFLQGGASTQFAMVPLNLLGNGGTADYILTGNWAKKAYQEASKYADCNIVASSEDQNFTYIPDLNDLTLNEDAKYLHLCSNNTLYGTRITSQKLPDTGSIPLIADMSSHILSENYPLEKFSLIYAGAQKNMGPAGLTVVILRDDLPLQPFAYTPTMLQYQTHIDKESMYNTPPTYSIYIMKLVLEWLKAQGGIQAMEQINQEKAALVYNFIDNSSFYNNTVRPEDRSLMNIPFLTPSKELDSLFVKEADKAGLINLKGHRLVGGLRASIYNGMPLEGVQALVEFMKQFELNNQ